MLGSSDILCVPARSRDACVQVVDDVGAVHAFDALGHAGVERVFEGPLYRSRIDLVRARRAQSTFLAPEGLLV
jgi:hypothetical protein